MLVKVWMCLYYIFYTRWQFVTGDLIMIEELHLVSDPSWPSFSCFPVLQCAVFLTITHISQLAKYVEIRNLLSSKALYLYELSNMLLIIWNSNGYTEFLILSGQLNQRLPGVCHHSPVIQFPKVYIKTIWTMVRLKQPI